MRNQKQSGKLTTKHETVSTTAVGAVVFPISPHNECSSQLVTDTLDLLDVTNNLILARAWVKCLFSSYMTLTLRLILNHRILIGHRRVFQGITDIARNSLRQTLL